MLNKLFSFYIVIFIIAAFLTSCSSKKNTADKQPEKVAVMLQENAQTSKPNSDFMFSAEEMIYQLKKVYQAQ